VQLTNSEIKEGGIISAFFNDNNQNRNLTINTLAIQAKSVTFAARNGISCQNSGVGNIPLTFTK